MGAQSDNDCNKGVPGLSKAVVCGCSSARNLHQSRPTDKEIRQTVDKEYNGTTRGSPADKLQRKAKTITSFQRKQERQANDMVKDYTIGDHGWVLMKKTYGKVCLVFENRNSLKFWTKKTETGSGQYTTPESFLM